MSTFEEKVEIYFKNADIDNSGFLSKLELSKVLEKAGDRRSPEEIVRWFDEIDANKDGDWSLEEVKSALSKRSPAEVTETELRAKFNDIDKDKSGLISVDELKQLLTQQGRKGDAAKYIALIDRNNDGKINFEEFLRIWKGDQ